MQETLALRIEGKVQGVWFRKHAQQKANSLGIVGTVGNLPDGSVYIIATGNRAALDTFTAWCHEGPLLARVERVEIKPLPLQQFSEFSILR